MPINMDETVTKLGFAIGAAFFGSIARARFWFYADDLKTASGQPDPRAGTLNRRRCFLELSSAVAIGMIAAAIGEYLHCPPIVTGGLAAALGTVGSAGIGELAEAFVKAIEQRILGSLK